MILAACLEKGVRTACLLLRVQLVPLAALRGCTLQAGMETALLLRHARILSCTASSPCLLPKAGYSTVRVATHRESGEQFACKVMTLPKVGRSNDCTVPSRETVMKVKIAAASLYSAACSPNSRLAA